MIEILVGIGAALFIMGGPRRSCAHMSAGLMIALGMIAAALLAIRIDAWLLHGAKKTGP